MFHFSRLVPGIHTLEPLGMSLSHLFRFLYHRKFDLSYFKIFSGLRAPVAGAPLDAREPRLPRIATLSLVFHMHLSCLSDAILPGPAPLFSSVSLFCRPAQRQSLSRLKVPHPANCCHLLPPRSPWLVALTDNKPLYSYNFCLQQLPSYFSQTKLN